MEVTIEKTITCFILGILIISSISCKKEVIEPVDDINENSIIFGSFVGLCVTECIQTYALSDSKLYKDASPNYDYSEFDFVELSNDEFLKVKDLRDFIPDQLLDETSTTIGCPGCNDLDSIYIQYVEDGVSKSWVIDPDLDKIPNYLHDFVIKVSESMAEIN